MTSVPMNITQLETITEMVAFYADTEDSIKDKYLEATTGIKLPDKKIILG